MVVSTTTPLLSRRMPCAPGPSRFFAASTQVRTGSVEARMYAAPITVPLDPRMGAAKNIAGFPLASRTLTPVMNVFPPSASRTYSRCDRSWPSSFPSLVRITLPARLTSPMDSMSGASAAPSVSARSVASRSSRAGDAAVSRARLMAPSLPSARRLPIRSRIQESIRLAVSDESAARAVSVRDRRPRAALRYPRKVRLAARMAEIPTESRMTLVASERTRSCISTDFLPKWRSGLVSKLDRYAPLGYSKPSTEEQA